MNTLYNMVSYGNIDLVKFYQATIDVTLEEVSIMTTSGAGNMYHLGDASVHKHVFSPYNQGHMHVYRTNKRSSGKFNSIYGRNLTNEIFISLKDNP